MAWTYHSVLVVLIVLSYLRPGAIPLKHQQLPGNVQQQRFSLPRGMLHLWPWLGGQGREEDTSDAERVRYEGADRHFLHLADVNWWIWKQLCTQPLYHCHYHQHRLHKACGFNDISGSNDIKINMLHCLVSELFPATLPSSGMLYRKQSDSLATICRCLKKKKMFSEWLCTMCLFTYFNSYHSL